MLVFGAIGLVANIAGIAILASGKDANLNMRVAFLEVLNDTLGSIPGLVAARVSTPVPARRPTRGAADGHRSRKAGCTVPPVQPRRRRPVLVLRACLASRSSSTGQAVQRGSERQQRRRFLCAISGRCARRRSTPSGAAAAAR